MQGGGALARSLLCPFLVATEAFSPNLGPGLSLSLAGYKSGEHDAWSLLESRHPAQLLCSVWAGTAIKSQILPARVPPPC